jgi:predicted acyltransferase
MKRYLPLDILRGLTIFGMVLSAIVPYGVLPPWMYHIQNPPPTHELDMTISGISWVDLVFPIFIFCMGVAIPLAGRKRIEAREEKREPKEKIRNTFLKEVFERFLMLWLFSYLYPLLDFSDVKGWLPQLATIAGFLSLFTLYFIFPKTGTSSFSVWLMKYKSQIRVSGIIIITLLIVAGHLFFGEVVSIHRRGIIIFLLAFLYLFGSLIWYFTRNNVRSRAIVFGLILLLSAVTMYFGLQGKVYAIKELRWILNLEYFYFLLILVPATFIGDLIYGGEGRQHTQIIKAELWLASLSVVTGIAAFFIEGSITKVPCTISYCFVTLGISIYLLMIVHYISQKGENGILTLFTRIFSGAGSNPLMSYIAFGSFVIPFFKLTGLILVYQAAYPPGYPWIGVARAFVAVLFTMSLVALMSEKKIFWRA